MTDKVIDDIMKTRVRILCLYITHSFIVAVHDFGYASSSSLVFDARLLIVVVVCG